MQWHVYMRKIKTQSNLERLEKFSLMRQSSASQSPLNCFNSKDINEPITWGEQIITKSCREEVLWRA